MAVYTAPVQSLIDELGRLPGVGPKTAERYAFWLLRQSPDRLQQFGSSIEHLRDQIAACARCHTFDDNNPCRYCRDSSRDQHTVCIVADTPDLLKGFNALADAAMRDTAARLESEAPAGRARTASAVAISSPSAWNSVEAVTRTSGRRMSSSHQIGRAHV